MFRSWKIWWCRVFWGEDCCPLQATTTTTPPPPPPEWEGKSLSQWSQEVVTEARNRGLKFTDGTAYDFVNKKLQEHPDYRVVMAQARAKHDDASYSSTFIPRSKLDDIIWIEKMRAYERYIPEAVRAAAMNQYTADLWQRAVTNVEAERKDKEE